MAYIGYARVSTQDQEAGFEAQLTALREIITKNGGNPDEDIFSERVSSVAEREQLNRARFDIAGQATSSSSPSWIVWHAR